MIRELFRPRVIVASLLLAALVVLGLAFADHTARTNACSPGFKGQIIRSEADAISEAKKRVIEERFFHRPTFDGEAFVKATEHKPNCCKAVRSETFFGVIIWEVILDAERDGHEFRNIMSLTNCGEIFHDSEFKD